MAPTSQAGAVACPGVSLRGVRRVFPGGVVAVDGVDLDVGPGEFVAVLGPSGCGKSTLLRAIAGLDPVQAGRIAVGAPGAGSSGAHNLAFVFQDAHLLPWRRVRSNVALPLELRGVERRSRRRSADDAIAQVELAEAASLFPSQLSGGMRMRVSLARALVTDPGLLLLDEPFAALDELTRLRLDEQLHALWRRRRMTVLFVTHSLVEAAFLAQRVVVLSRRPARLVGEVTVALAGARTAELRTAPEFAALVRELQALLAAGGG